MNFTFLKEIQERTELIKNKSLLECFLNGRIEFFLLIGNPR